MNYPTPDGTDVLTGAPYVFWTFHGTNVRLRTFLP